MDIRETLEYIGTKTPQAKKEDFSGHNLGDFVRKNAPENFEPLLNEFPNITVKGSIGNGRWADVIWIAFLDSLITDSTLSGYYVVYLFSSDGSEVYLTLAQGVTRVEQEFGKHTRNELRRRAKIMEERLSKNYGQFESGIIDLGAKTPLAKNYEQSVGIWKKYSTANLPSNAKLESDFLQMLHAYRDLFRAGGTQSITYVIDEPEIPDDISHREAKIYSQHFHIERNAKLGAKVKKLQGYACKGCGFNFEAFYGERGKEYIEAHHLIPLYMLNEGDVIDYDPIEDFAVLCANCHRMVHRKKDELLSIEDLQKIIKESQSKL